MPSCCQAVHEKLAKAADLRQICQPDRPGDRGERDQREDSARFFEEARRRGGLAAEAGQDAMTPRAVFDCMDFLQGLGDRRVPPGACFRLVDEPGRMILCVSADILAEVRDVLTRPKTQKKFPLAEPRKGSRNSCKTPEKGGCDRRNPTNH